MWGSWGRRKTDRRETRRSRSSTLHLELTGLEDRRLQAIVFPVSTSAKPDPLVVPKVLVPADGRYVPVTVSGTFKQYYAANFVKSYAPYPVPVITALNVASRVHPEQGSSGTVMVQIPGVATPLKVDYLPNPNVYNQEILVIRTVPEYLSQQVSTRLKARPLPKYAVLTVTDQYRRDEPQAYSPLVVTNLSLNANDSNFTFPLGKGTEVVSVPTGYLLERDFSYSFTVNLQALKNAGTNGRQYSLNVFAADADDGSQANTVAVVPSGSASK